MNTNGMRVALAGLAGGVVMFFWGFVSHMLLPLGDAGISTLTYEEELLPALSKRITQPGLYQFPWPESSPGTPMPQDDVAMKKAEEMHNTMPHGLLLFHPPTGPFSMTPHLIVEFATNVVSSFIAAVLVCLTLGSLARFVRETSAGRDTDRLECGRCRERAALELV